MLDTLIQIGKAQSAGKSLWSNKTQPPEGKTTLCSITFDADNQIVTILPEKQFDTQCSEDYRCMDVLKGRNLNALVTVASEHLPQLKKSLLGGEFLMILRDKKNKDCNHLEHSIFGEALLKIFEMQKVFENCSDTEGYLTNKNNVLAVAIKCQELGLITPKFLAHFDEFEEYAQIKIFKTTLENNTKKLCYATGETTEDVRSLELTERFSLNKMFVTETKNYLSDFSKNNTSGNYQVAKHNQTLLDIGSKFIRDNWRISIAEVDHVILPKLQGENPVWGDILLNKLKNRAELVFKTQPLENLNQDLVYSDEMYWLTFLGYDSDGNSFKTINIIQDINGLYFDNMIVNLQKTHRTFDNLKGFNWDTIMTYKNREGELVTTGFNFPTIYRCIPARKNPTGKKYKNIALSFFKAILEQRKIDRQQIFEYFRDLILCHRFKRYDGYENVRPAYSKYSKSKFDDCVIQAVFQYAAIIHFLEKLNLIKDDKNVSKMEIQEKSILPVSEASKQIEDFFEKMHYTSEQKAMFYLGKVLNWIGFAQSAKQHESKPILGHVNYNGMDYNAIVRLKKELFLKIKQYHKFSYKGVMYNSFSTCSNWLDQFEKHFALDHANPKSWQLSREATLFYLLSGYSFRTEKEVLTVVEEEDNQ